MSFLKIIASLGILAIVSMIIIPAYADSMVKATSGGTINVSFSTDPANPTTEDTTQLKIGFLNKQNSIQQHIDYKVSVMQGSSQVFGIPITHTAEGSVSVPFQFQTNGKYQVTVEVDGILFQPIPPETATFDVQVGPESSVPEFPESIVVILITGIISIIVLSNRLRIFQSR